MHLKSGGTAGALRPPGERSAGPGRQRAEGLREGALPANWRCARPENDSTPDSQILQSARDSGLYSPSAPPCGGDGGEAAAAV